MRCSSRSAKAQKVIRTITGLKEPQGVGYVPSTDTLYVSNAGDGSVHLFQGADLSPSGRIELGDDADNIRVDMQAHRVFIGYGNGALAVIDPSSRAKVADIHSRRIRRALSSTAPMAGSS